MNLFSSEKNNVLRLSAHFCGFVILRGQSGGLAGISFVVRDLFQKTGFK